MCCLKIVSKIVLMLGILINSVNPGFAGEKEKITLLMGVSSSHKVSQGIAEVLTLPVVADRYDFYFYTDKDLENKKIDNDIIAQSKIIIVDDMHRSFTKYVINNADFDKTKVYGLCSTAKEPEKIISDPKVKQYHRPDTIDNIKNLLFFLLKRDCGLDVNYEEPQNVPKMGIFHPKSDKIFDNFEEYISWYKAKGFYKKNGFWVGVPELSSYIFPGETGAIVSSLIENLEENNINVLPIYSFPSYLALEKFFFDEQGKSRVNLIAAFSFKFASPDDKRTQKNLIKLGVPLLDPIRMYMNSIPEWRESPQGLGPIEISYTMSTPEFNGVVEPSVLGGRVALKDERTGRVVYKHQPIMENIEFFIRRIKAWRNLQAKENKDKKIAILYWNHTPGKQNIGATYLNLFRSLEEILKKMGEEGYHINGKLPSEEEIKDFVLKSGRNIGSWAPGELDELITAGKVIRLPFSRYREWYKNLDEDYRQKLGDEWGKVDDSDIMIKNKVIIIPYVNLGNIILVPQPSRGWSDDPMKLYHSTQLWPHHQYTAFYLWLTHEFKADAIISLGTHGTHEWLPGKQAGLSQSCPPEVLIQDLPNIYPYIMDDIGEGLQAKRRGRAVIIDHLIPSMKKAGVYEEYRDLSVLINEYNDALTRSTELANEKHKKIKTLVKTLGVDKDLLLKEVNEEAIEKIEHYLIELQEANVPYGMHTFGVSPKGEALEEFSLLIKERNQDLALDEIKKRLSSCSLEIDQLIEGLDGKYILAGEGNDPLRNPDAIPTGKNFYGFDPAKVPSREAFDLGQKQAEEMIAKYLKENGEYPNKIGLILWSIELQRNEGTQVGTALYLLGMKPVWDKNNKITGVIPISGAKLGRPRIDVHMQSSGLFRDAYPNLILLLDEAVRQAGRLTDVENFIAQHNQKIKAYLIKKGYGEDEADILSKIRVFSAKPGSYGTKMGDIIGASGHWDSDAEIADAFINFVSFGYGKNIWGKPLEPVYKKNLEDVKVSMHTRSSNIFGVLDADGTYEYLGAFSLAVKRVSGEYPDVILSDQRNPDKAHIEDIERTIGEELRSRYLNPKWIEGMKKEDYAGARQIDKFVEYMWGWQVTTPFAIDEAKWEQTFEVYVEDKYNLKIKEFFNKANPWAYQSITARMLEAVRKDYWQADDITKQKLAKEYAVSVVEKGVACCDHTCNNPLLNQMVVNIISIPGVLPDKIVNEFKIAVEKATGEQLSKHVKKIEKVIQDIKAGFKKKTDTSQQNAETADKELVPDKGKAQENVKGYKIEEVTKENTKTEMTSSGVEWVASLFVVFLLCLVATGAVRSSRENREI